MNQNLNDEERNITVFAKDGRLLAPCTHYRSKQMIRRGKAVRIGQDAVQLLYDRDDERRFRQEVLERDDYTCYIEEVQLPREELTMDHIRSRERGGSDFPENLACCSLKHNRAKGKMDLEEYIQFLISSSDTNEALRLRLVKRFPQWTEKGVTQDGR